MASSLWRSTTVWVIRQHSRPPAAGRHQRVLLAVAQGSGVEWCRSGCRDSGVVFIEGQSFAKQQRESSSHSSALQFLLRDPREPLTTATTTTLCCVLQNTDTFAAPAAAAGCNHRHRRQGNSPTRGPAARLLSSPSPDLDQSIISPSHPAAHAGPQRPPARTLHERIR